MAMLINCLLLFIIFSMGNTEGNQHIYLVKTLAILKHLGNVQYICTINKGVLCIKYTYFQHIITKTYNKLHK